MDTVSSNATTNGAYYGNEKLDYESSLTVNVSELDTMSRSSDLGGSSCFSESKDRVISTSTRMIAPAARKTALENELTINKLNFNFRDLYGRESELRQLEDLLHRVKDSKQTEVVLLRGYSGVGKSALISKLKSPTRKLGGLMAIGKYDLSQRNDGYRGVSAAIGGALSQVAARRGDDSELFKRVISTIREDLGTELSLVKKVVPLLQELIPTEDDFEEAKKMDESNLLDTGTIETKNQYIYAFRRLIRALAKHFAPFVLVVDDLQWADLASLDVFESVAMDSGEGSIMLCGLYRSNEVDEKHYLSQVIRNLDPKAQMGGWGLTQMEIGNLSHTAVRQLLQEVLSSTDDAKVTNLAALCRERTQGNIFFLLQFLTMLKDKCLLEFNFGSLSWRWDISEIEQNTIASDNVADILMAKLKMLGVEDRLVLQVASCFGQSFREDMLQLVWENVFDGETNIDVSSTSLKKIIDKLVREGYFQNQKSGHYRFSHDKIQEAVVALPVPEMIPDLGYKVGLILLEKMAPQTLNSAITIVVDLLNEGLAESEDSERIKLARLNRRASKQSMSIASFESAARYARVGIGCLGPSKWDHRELALELFTLGAEAEGLLGHLDTMGEYYNEVVAQTDLPMIDKLGVCTAYCVSVAGQGRPDEALAFARDLLKKFGCHFPKRNSGFLVQLGKELLSVKSRIRSGVMEKLHESAKDEDSVRQRLAVLLDKLCLFCYLCGDKLFVLANFRSLDWTLRYGLNEYSPLALAGTAVSLVALGNVRDASVLGKVSLSLVDSYPLDVQCRTALNIYGHVLHWTQPLRNSTKPLVQSYDFGLRSGLIDIACWSILTYALIRMLTSHPYHMQVEDLVVYARQCQELKQDFPLRFFLVFWQVCENLVGKPGANKVMLYGDRLSESDAKKWAQENVTFEQHYAVFQGFLYALYGEHEKGAQLALEKGADGSLKAFPGSALLYWDALMKGLSCFAAARLSKNRKYKKIGFTMYRRVKDWISQGNPNVNHIAALLEAEIEALKNKPFNAISKYEAAILLSARSGLLMEAGIASERLAELLLECKRTDDAKYRFENAIAYYTEVGALLKVDLLQAERAELWPRPTDIITYKF